MPNKTLPKRNFWSSFFNLSDWLNLVCLLITLGVVIWSVQQARWVKPSPSFITIFVLAVVVGFILAKSRLPAIAAHFLAILIGAVVVFWQGLSLVYDPDLTSRVLILMEKIQDWWHSQVNSIPSTNTLHIALIFGLLTWIVGYSAIWPLVKKRNPWVAVLLGTIIILINLNFWSKDKYYYFLLFIIAALALIMLATFTRYNSQITKIVHSGINWAPKLWILATVCLITIAVYLTWLSPGFRIAAIDTYAKANSPFKGTFEVFWQNFFATVPGSGSPMLTHGGQQELQLGGSLKLSDQVDYIIDTDYKTYWKTQIYDYYTSQGWKASAIDSKTIQGTTGAGAPSDNQLSYTVVPQVNTNVVPTVGEFVSGSLPILERTLAPMVFEINLNSSSGDALLPPDIASVAQNIRTARSITSRFVPRSDQQLAALLPGNLKLVSINRSGTTVQSISVARTQPEDKSEIALTSAQIIEHQKEATITVQVPPKVFQSELDSAGTNYPMQITDRYLQLPGNLPARVKELAIAITQAYNTPYKKAQAIKDFLSDYPYSLTIDPPPDNADGVDYFLFSQKSGYCTYFASAMTVMLRSAGIPARMVVGFLPGQYDSDTHSYIIRDRDYHAWTEIYFPGHGWITFDATPSNALTGSAGGVTDILPDNSDYSNLDYGQGTSDTVSSPIDFGYYISLSASVIAGIILLLIIIFCIRIYSRPKNSSAVYSRMVFLASVAGLGPKRWQTVLEFSNRLSTALPKNAGNIDTITQAYIVACYSNGTPAISHLDNLKKSWTDLRNALIKRLLHLK